MPESFERGALTEATYYILLALCTPRHGYAVMQYVAELSRGRVALGAGTLYGALGLLLEKQWIEAMSEQGESLRAGRQKKEYILTVLGREALRAEIERLSELLVTGKTVLGGYENA